MIFLNLLIDFIPNTIGTTTACKWAKNNKEKNNLTPIKCRVLNYLKREKYHFAITTNIIVRTKGKAGYLD